MTTPQYGDARLVICEQIPGRAERTTRIVAIEPAAWPFDACKAAAVGLTPWSSVVYERFEGTRYYTGAGWERVVSAETCPCPGYGAADACYCQTCGIVAFDGESLACDHGTPSERKPRAPMAQTSLPFSWKAAS